jgi:hypothetical protein
MMVQRIGQDVKVGDAVTFEGKGMYTVAWMKPVDSKRWTHAVGLTSKSGRTQYLTHVDAQGRAHEPINF